MANVMVTGAVRCIKAVVASMRERRSGCIVNATSISGRRAGTPMGPYAASRFALEALSECLAQEVEPFGVRVALDDDAWYDRVEADFGLDARPKP